MNRWIRPLVQKQGQELGIEQLTDSDQDNKSDKESREETENCPRGRKRKRNFNIDKRQKIRRNSGKEYKCRRGKGKLIEEKSIGPDCLCKRKYFDIIKKEERETVLKHFWGMGNFNTQNAYLFGCLTVVLKGRNTKPKDSTSRRTHTVKYTLTAKENMKVQVCKKAFLSIHGLQMHRGRVENIVKNLQLGLLTPKMDGRGQHGHHVKKYSDQQIEFVKSFIERLSKYESHYSRNDNHKTFYMTMDYTIEKCYEVYKMECLKENFHYVSSDKFRRIFIEDFNIHFKSPKTDTCSVCDNLHIAIREAKSNNINKEELRRLEIEQELHHRKAKAGQDAIKEAKKEAMENNLTYAITFDLQQALPTPKLSTGPTFYKKLFCYNLSIHALHPS